MPNFVVAKIRRERIWFSVGKDQGTDRVGKSARNEQGDGSHAKLGVNGTDQKNDDPAHQQIADIRHQDGNFPKENGFERDEKDSQTPNDAKQNPACAAAKDCQTKWGVGACDEQVNCIVIENAEDAQIFAKEQKEMQKTTKQQGQE